MPKELWMREGPRLDAGKAYSGRVPWEDSAATARAQNFALTFARMLIQKANAKRFGFNPSNRIPKGDPGEGQAGGGDTATQSLRQMQRETGEAGWRRVRPRSCHSA